jgi:hypothetical protein
MEPKKEHTQKENTAVMVMTGFHGRNIIVKKRRPTENGWRDDPNFGQRQFWLENGSIFMLHPDDERPKKRAGQRYFSQFQHGVDVRNGISVALVFRVVTSKAKVCC